MLTPPPPLPLDRQVGKLDEKRFHMYLAHLRDMYSFDPKAVDTLLKDMRILAANAEQNYRRIKRRPLPKPITHACRTKNNHGVAVESGNDQASKSSPAEDGAIKLGESNRRTSIT